MRRRSTVGSRTRPRKPKPKRRNARKAARAPSAAQLQDQLELRTRELNEALEQQRATAEVLRVVSSSTFDLQTVLDALVQSAARLCAADTAIIWRARGTTYHLAAAYGLTPDFKQQLEQLALQPGGSSIVGRTLQAGRALHIPDTLRDPAYTGRSLEDIGARAMLGVPLLRDGIATGVMTVGRLSAREFTDQQIALVSTFADQAVIAIENVRLLAELRQRTGDLSEALEQQTATSEVLQVISSSPGELEPVFRAMLENATRICNAKFGTMFRFDGDAFHLMAMVNTPLALTNFLQRRGRFVPEAGNGLYRVWKSKKPLHILDDAASRVPSAPAKLAGAH